LHAHARRLAAGMQTLVERLASDLPSDRVHLRYEPRRSAHRAALPLQRSAADGDRADARARSATATARGAGTV
jgi:hypothetical protein